MWGGGGGEGAKSNNGSGGGVKVSCFPAINQARAPLLHIGTSPRGAKGFPRRLPGGWHPLEGGQGHMPPGPVGHGDMGEEGGRNESVSPPSPARPFRPPSSPSPGHRTAAFGLPADFARRDGAQLAGAQLKVLRLGLSSGTGKEEEEGGVRGKSEGGIRPWGWKIKPMKPSCPPCPASRPAA